jgi:hypothetical protein
MHEWWDPDHMAIMLAALRQLRRRRRVFLVIDHSGWRVL